MGYLKNRKQHKPEPLGRDNCQTPPYALSPLLPYLGKDKVIWEPARGEGYLVEAMRKHGLNVVFSSLECGQDFFAYQPNTWDILVTNPPFSRVIEWLERCYSLDKPFALLMKTEIMSNQGIQKLCARYGDFEHIFPETRINYKMPNKGWESPGATFNTHWYTWKLGVGRPFTYLAPILYEKKMFHKQPGQVRLF